MRVWLDTDIGTDVDDVLALAYVLRHPDMELVGVSTVFGDVSLRTAIAERLLAIAEAPAIPVLSGTGVPMADRRHGIMLGHEGRGLLENPQPRLRTREETGAADRIEAIAGAVTDAAPDVLVAIGPLTNVAALSAPGVLDRIPQLAVMGGKIADVMLPGMVSHISEWNWFCDPVAVQSVLAAPSTVGAEPMIVPAEVTFRTRLEESDIDMLADGDGLTRCVADLCREWLKTQAEDLDVAKPLVALHDPLTTAVLNREDLCTFEPRRISVDDTGATSVHDGPSNVRVATTVDAESARTHIMDVLTGTC